MIEQIQTQCCIVGGGPAGMMLGLLLARHGNNVVVLEKHADFLRDFRGDTVHPSTLEIMHELGILDQFLQRPHQEVQHLGGQIGDEFVPLADFSHVSTRCKFVALMPQWHFLNFLAEQAKKYPGFRLIMEAEATDLIHKQGKISGVLASTPEGQIEVQADLTVGADGRRSIIRERANLQVVDLGAPMDVLWLRLSRKDSDPPQTLGRIGAGRIFIMINRDEYWQCAFVIAKDTFAQLKENGLPAFCRDILGIAPYLEDRVKELKDWNDISLLTVKVDHLRRWYRPGLVCIGDAAHAMSPIGGVGINLAIQDAVAAANILAEPLTVGNCSVFDLDKIQKRREFPTQATQKVQVTIQNQIISHVLSSKQKPALAWPLKLFRRFPLLRRIPAQLIGVGVRPEHVKI